MRFIQIFLLVFISVFSGQLAARGLPDFTGLVEKNSRAVVNIATTITESSSPRGLGPNGELPENVPEELREYFRKFFDCLLYTSPSPRDQRGSRMPSSA